MNPPTILVTGASGHLGRRVLELLIAQDASASGGRGPERSTPRLVATTRHPEALADLSRAGVDVRRADYDDPASLVAAFRGVDRALLVSTDALDRPGQRVAQQTAAAHALDQAGVSHVVYTSAAHRDRSSRFIVFVDHRATEEALQAARYGWTLLRNNLYADLFLFSLPTAVASGKLVDARGNGRFAVVTRDDCARAAAAALSSPFEGRRALDVTGPAALTSGEVAELLSAITSRPIEHVSVSEQARREGMLAHGVPATMADVVTGFDAEIARGNLADVSSAVTELTGSPAQTLEAFLRDHQSALLPPPQS